MDWFSNSNGSTSQGNCKESKDFHSIWWRNTWVFVGFSFRDKERGWFFNASQRNDYWIIVCRSIFISMQRGQYCFNCPYKWLGACKDPQRAAAVVSSCESILVTRYEGLYMVKNSTGMQFILLGPCTNFPPIFYTFPPFVLQVLNAMTTRDDIQTYNCLYTLIKPVLDGRITGEAWDRAGIHCFLKQSSFALLAYRPNTCFLGFYRW